jgi:hypothetical protein
MVRNTAYRGLLIRYACEGPGLPPGLVAEARSLDNP